MSDPPFSGGGGPRAWGRGGAPRRGSCDPPARWTAFVSASPRWFAPPITTVPAEGPSAEWFDRSLPRHPPPNRGGPGACPSVPPRFLESPRPPVPAELVSRDPITGVESASLYSPGG